MHILAFDTCFDACSACVAEVRNGVVIEMRSVEEQFETGHAERLVPFIEQLMSVSEIEFADLDRIAVTVGPGTFTGTRIGVAVARGLALATGVKVVGVSSLAVMAHGAARELGARSHEEQMAVLVDARRGEVYAQLFSASGAVMKSEPMLLSIENAAELAGVAPLLAVGSGAEAVAEVAAHTGRHIEARLPHLLPHADSLAAIAATMAPAEVVPSPLYLRQPDAKPQAGRPVARMA